MNGAATITTTVRAGVAASVASSISTAAGQPLGLLLIITKA